MLLNIRRAGVHFQNHTMNNICQMQQEKIKFENPLPRNVNLINQCK